EAQSLDQIVDTFKHSLEQDFQIDFASLVLIGNPAQFRGVRARMVTLADAREQVEGLLKSSKAVCGVLRPEEVKFLFPEHSRQVGSSAVIPLHFGQPLGVLAIASTDPNYFRSSIDTLFFCCIAEVLNLLLSRNLVAGY